MSSLLEGKRLLVMGGTTGLGLSAAQAFVKQGARVLVVGRNEANVNRAVTQLGANALGLAADAAKPETAVEALKRMVLAWDGLEIHA